MHVKITYLDTAMAIIEIGSLRLLTDPVLDDAGTKYDDGVIALEKTTPSAMSVDELGRIDAVLLSHDQHSDNLDTRGRELLTRIPLILTTPEAARRLGANATGLEPWQQSTITGADGFAITVTAAPAQHGPDGTQDLTGPVTGFLIDWDERTAQGPIYISGDTVPFDGTIEIAERAAPVSLALLHIGHVSPGPDAGIHLSLSAVEAIKYANDLRADVVVPLHFEGWKHFSEESGAAFETFQNSDFSTKTHWLKQRESLELDL